MGYSKKDLTFIIYNNRSPKLVENFLINKNLDINKYKLIKIESIITNLTSNLRKDNLDITFKLSDLDLSKDDIIFKLDDLESMTNILTDMLGEFSDRELSFLKKRGFVENIYNEFLSLDNIVKNKLDLDILGISIHPTLTKVLINGESGGIVIPLSENNKIVNLAIRRIGIDNNKNSKTLKYSLSCPDLDIWGLESINQGDDVWITEGIFDMYALALNGLKAISVSSPHWSSIQLYRLLEKKPSKINIFSDNDVTGINSSIILFHFFKSFNIKTTIYVSTGSKDASEHFFEKGNTVFDLSILNVEEMLDTNHNNNFNYIDYLKNRSFL